MTTLELAAALGVSKTTLARWRARVGPRLLPERHHAQERTTAAADCHSRKSASAAPQHPKCDRARVGFPRAVGGALETALTNPWQPILAARSAPEGDRSVSQWIFILVTTYADGAQSAVCCVLTHTL